MPIESKKHNKEAYERRISELSKKYHLREEKVANLCAKYDSIDNFIRMYREGEFSKDDIIKYNGTLINNKLDIDMNPNSEEYSRFIDWLILSGRVERSKFLFKQKNR